MQKYVIDPIDDTKVHIQKESFIDDILSANPNCKTFIFENGQYYLNDILRIDISGIVFIGASKQAKNVHIIQTNTAKDGIDIRNVGNVTFDSISIHTEHLNKLALTVAGCNSTTITNCTIYGCANTFSVYYAGPTNISEGSSSLNAYYINALDDNNVFTNNVVYAKWSGDAISFSFQKNGTFEKNIVRGGKVAIYMCKDTLVDGNIIYDSSSHGIYLSLPSKNIKLTNNKIYECVNSGIKISKQREHGPFATDNYNIKLSRNYIYDSKYYSIEINYGVNISVKHNKFISTDIYGIYCYKCDDIKIIDNKLSYFKVAIWSELSKNIEITSNTICSVYPDKGDNYIKLIDSDRISILSNTYFGEINYDIISVNNSTNITNDMNKQEKYYSYEQELSIMK